MFSRQCLHIKYEAKKLTTKIEYDFYFALFNSKKFNLMLLTYKMYISNLFFYNCLTN